MSNPNAVADNDVAMSSAVVDSQTNLQSNEHANSSAEGGETEMPREDQGVPNSGDLQSAVEADDDSEATEGKVSSLGIGQADDEYGSPSEVLSNPSSSDSVKEGADTSEVSIEEKTTLALSSKVAGNEKLQQSEFQMAANHYKRGLKHIKALSNEVHGVKEVRKALSLNLSLALLKLDDPSGAARAASQALEIEPANIKALYRRGVGRSRAGELDGAKNDLLVVCRAEPNNTEARTELEGLKAKMQKAREAEKKTLGGFLSTKTGTSLYSDREEEQKRRLEAQKKEEAEKRLKYEAHVQSLVSDDAAPTDVPTYDEWVASEEEKEKKEREAKQKDEEEKRRIEQDATKRARLERESGAGKSDTAQKDVDDDGDLSPEDVKMLEETKKKGYCYFKRDLTETEKLISAKNLPQRITDPSSVPTSSPAPQPLAVSAPLREAADQAGVATLSHSESLSSWNASGTTYEEKDMSSWCHTNLEKFLLKANAKNEMNPDALLSNMNEILDAFKPTNTTSPNMGLDANKLGKFTTAVFPWHAKITKVKSLEGEGQVAVVRSTKRYLFDYRTTLSWSIQIDDMDPMAGVDGINASPEGSQKGSEYKGEMTLEDVSSSLPSNFSWENADVRVTYKTSIKDKHKAAVADIFKKLKTSIGNQIHQFSEAYKAASG